MNLPQDSLSRTLAAWRVEPRRDPQFRAAVRARITSAAGSSWTAFARAHVTLVAGALAVAMLLGALTGREQARARVEADNGRIASAYVQSLDARAMAMH